MNARIAKHRAIVAEIKKAPCTDCGQTYPSYVMDFDHTSTQKLLNVSALCGWSLKALLTEIGKCELVCSNCHRIRTHERRNILAAPAVL